MPLVPPVVPDTAERKRALASSLPDFINPADPLARELARGEHGVPVAVFSLQDLRSGAPLASAHQIGWGFLAGTAAGPAVAAQISRPAPDQPAVLTSFARGAEIAELIKAQHDAARLAPVLASDYELWVLRIPGILVETFWLRSRSAAPDLVVPFHTVSRELKTMHPYTWGEFLQVAQPIAESFQGFDELKPGGGTATVA